MVIVSMRLHFMLLFKSGKLKKACFYNGYDPRTGNSAINSEGIGMRTWGLISWVSGLTGCCDWEFMWKGNNKGANYFYEPNVKNFAGRACYIYKAELLGLEKGPLPSMRLKMIRRGLQDIEYLWLLSQKTGDRAEANKVALGLVWQTLGRPADTIKLPAGCDDLRKKAAAATAVAVNRNTREKCERSWTHAPLNYYKARMGLIKRLAGSSKKPGWKD